MISVCVYGGGDRRAQMNTVQKGVGKFDLFAL